MQTDDEVRGASCSDDAEGMREWLRKHCPELLMEGLLISVMHIILVACQFQFSVLGCTGCGRIK